MVEMDPIVFSEPEAETEGDPEPEGFDISEHLLPELNATAEDLIAAEPEFEGAEVPVWITAYTLTIVLILVGNALIISAMVRGRGCLQRASNICLLSLVISRAAVAILVVPARITGVYSERYLGSVLCKLCHYAGFASTTSSVLSTTSVAFVKYNELKNNGEFISPRKAKIFVALLWVFSAVYATRANFLFDLNQVTITEGAEPLWLCTVSPHHRGTDTAFMFVDLVLLFVAPVCVIVYSYSRAIQILRAAANKGRIKKIPNVIHALDLGGNPELLKEQARRRKESLNTMRMLVAVASLFFLCALAPYILRLYRYSNGYFQNYNSAEQIVYLWSYSNGWLNVIVLMHYRDDLYRGVMRILRRSLSTDDSSTMSTEKNPQQLQNDNALEQMKCSANIVS